MNPAEPLRPVVIIGCGLIGGSVGLALRALDAAPRVVGVDDETVLREAYERGAIDEGQPRTGPWSAALANAGTLILALPPSALMDLLTADLHVPDSVELVLDVAGVKKPVLQQAGAAGVPNFVGGHPMAGSERGGLAHASASLFAGRDFVLCAPAGAPLRRARSLVAALGAHPVELSPTAHDEAVALTSHLPHVVAQALMRCLLDRAQQMGRDPAELLAAGSWRDATRVAASDPALWSTLFELNAGPLGDALDQLLEVLTEARARLHQRDRASTPVDDPSSLQAARERLHQALPAPHRAPGGGGGGAA